MWAGKRDPWRFGIEPRRVAGALKTPHPRPLGRLFRFCHTPQGAGLALGLRWRQGDKEKTLRLRRKRAVMLGRDVTSALCRAGPYVVSASMPETPELSRVGLPYYPSLGLLFSSELAVWIF